MVNCVPGSPIDWAAIIPTDEPSLTKLFVEGSIPYSKAVKPFLILLDKGDITRTRVIPNASISAAISSVIKEPEDIINSDGLDGF